MNAGPRVLIVGGAGQLGRALRETAPPSVHLITSARSELDLTRGDSIDAVIRAAKPGVVVNAAGYTAVERAESEPDLAHAVNAVGATALAEAAYRAGARLIHVSTDFVFDGACGRPYRPNDTAAPLGVYGASKLAGERGVAAATGGEGLIVRTAWLYGTHGANFVETMLRRMGQGPVRVVVDQVGTPTWARSLAEALWSAVARPAVRGLYHWTDAGVASWYDFAVAIQEEALVLGLLTRAEEIVPIRTEEYPSRARRPPYAVLDTRDTRDALGRSPEHWRVNLRRMLAEVARG